MQGNDANVLAEAERLYNEAVHETPPNRNQLDKLVDLLCSHPQLLYDAFFAKGHKAAGIVVDIWHGAGDMLADDNLLILMPPAVWGWTVMEETVCHAPPLELMETRYPQLAQQFLELAQRTLEHPDSTPGPIVRRAIQSLTRFWPEIIHACIILKTSNPVWQQMFEAMLRLADMIVQLSERSDDPALQIHLVKFLETEAAIFTAVPPLQPGATPSRRSMDTLSLDKLPDTHPYISKSVLATRGDRALQQLVELLPSSDHIRLCNTSFITAIINSMVYLMNLRPQFCEQLLERLTNWYALINSSEQIMTHLQLGIIGKTLRIALLHLYTRRYMGAYSEVLEHTLDTLGGLEWTLWQEHQQRVRERQRRHKEWERSLVPRKKDVDEGPHSARWVPAPEDGQEEPAYQPAPVADSENETPPLKRLVDLPDSDAENKDSHMQIDLAEDVAKRAKIDDKKAEPAAVSEEEIRWLQEQQQRAIEADPAMEAEMQAALESDNTFELPMMDTMPSEERHKHVLEAFRRVCNGKERMGKFIDHKLALHGAGFMSGSSPASKLLEDNMIQQVQLVANCYLVLFEACRAGHISGDMGASSQWGEMHKCASDVLDYVVGAPRVRYRLAMTLLYELWMSVVATDPELVRTPDKSDNEFTVLALYRSWCERIFGAILMCTMESAGQQAEVATVATAAAESSDSTAVVPQQKQQPERGELVLEFIKDAPYMAPTLLSKVEVCLKSPDTAALGVAILEQAIEIRPPIFNAGLDLLLKYSTHSDRATRAGCIGVVMKHYPNSALTHTISKSATSTFRLGMNNAAKQSTELEDKVAAIFDDVDHSQLVNDQPPAEAIEKKKSEAFTLRKQEMQTIENGLVVHMELLLSLCTKNMSLLASVFELYKGAPLAVQIAIRRIVTPLVMSMASKPDKIIPVLFAFPVGAETLAQRIIFLLCADPTRAPAKELVQAVLSMCVSRRLDGNILVYLASGMSHEEALLRLPMVVGILNNSEGPRVLVRECFTRLTTSYPNQPGAAMTPIQLLMGLHALAVAASEKKAIEAVGICEAMTKSDGTPAFPTTVFDDAIKQLGEQDSVPPLVLNTASIYRGRRQGQTATVLRLMQRMIERSFWAMGSHAIKAFVACFRTMVPDALPLALSIPTDVLQKMAEIDSQLGASIRDYATSISNAPSV